MCKAPAGQTPGARHSPGVSSSTGSKPKMTASGAAFPERRRSRRSSPGYARETVQRISQKISPLCPARSASPAVKRRRSAPFSPGFGSSGLPDAAALGPERDAGRVLPRRAGAPVRDERAARSAGHTVRRHEQPVCAVRERRAVREEGIRPLAGPRHGVPGALRSSHAPRHAAEEFSAGGDLLLQKPRVGGHGRVAEKPPAQHAAAQRVCDRAKAHAEMVRHHAPDADRPAAGTRGSEIDRLPQPVGAGESGSPPCAGGFPPPRAARCRAQDSCCRARRRSHRPDRGRARAGRSRAPCSGNGPWRQRRKRRSRKCPRAFSRRTCAAAGRIRQSGRSPRDASRGTAAEKAPASDIQKGCPTSLPCRAVSDSPPARG